MRTGMYPCRVWLNGPGAEYGWAKRRAAQETPFGSQPDDRCMTGHTYSASPDS